ncbi:MAG: DUF72 domain-containing protein [Paludibacteraceae bacterium]
MKYGKVDKPELVDFTLPIDSPTTAEVLFRSNKENFKVSVGCAKWNRTDLKGFYPRGTKDELSYYSTQFNSIELNATFYNMPSREQVVKWRDKTPDGFKFFPKITNSISHYRRLLNVKDLIDVYCDAVAYFEEKLGMVFLQLNEQFSPNEFGKLIDFVTYFPKVIPLGVEVRNEKWFSDAGAWNDFCKLLEENQTTNLVTDVAGRRDMVHQRLTTPAAFIRFTGCNVDEIDRRRMNDWAERIAVWKAQGLENLYFFVHQNFEVSSPLLSGYFVQQLNEKFGTDLIVPDVYGNG